MDKDIENSLIMEYSRASDAVHWLFWQMKLYWNTAKPSCPLTYILSRAVFQLKQQSSCNRHYMAQKAKGIYYLVLFRKVLLIPAL